MKKIFSEIKTIAAVQKWQNKNPDFCFIPTMGALHAGHISLIRLAKKKNIPVLVSLFVNQVQFAPDEDFDTYPRTYTSDVTQLLESDADAIWTPSTEEIYPHGLLPEIPPLPDVFTQAEGVSRPTHFTGVAQVITRFFEIIHPQYSFFGQKDYQQTVLIHWLAEQFQWKTHIEVCPIIRESSGLALSSRNIFLTEQEKTLAKTLSLSLLTLKEMYKKGERETETLLNVATKMLQSISQITVEYLEIRDARTFVTTKSPESSVVVLAARIGKVRLLDNILL